MHQCYGRTLLVVIVAGIMLSGCQRNDGYAGSPGASVPGDSPVSSSPGGSSLPDTDIAAARGTVSGFVRSSDGAPVAGAMIQPRSLDAPARPVPEMVVMSDRDGRYQWSLDPGRYEISVTPPASAGQVSGPPPQVATVVAGQTVTIDFAFPTGR